MSIQKLLREVEESKKIYVNESRLNALLESYEELLAAAKGYLDNSVSDIGRQGRQAHGALLQAITNAEKLSQ